MTWSPLTLDTPTNSALAVNHNVGIFSATPWTQGIREGQGNQTWLSFPNAVEAVAIDLYQLQAEAALAIAVAAANWTDLATQIDLLSTDFPLRELSQWQRHVVSLSRLENDKFSLGNPEVFCANRSLHSLPVVTRQAEKAISQQALASSNAYAASDPLANLSAFQTTKLAHDAEVNTNLPALSGGAGWRFYADSDISNAIRVGHPGPEMTRTAMLVFHGSAVDLAYLKELLT